ncbi:hypothetical protein CJ030_MR7G006002 [Morella rubra]|uniref:Pentatricopeptide repeat-containing protein n=1 Tax=Morella rubra TaxID=262757 RepID=A0A6A1V265_9ROSI|nr:hypothetical protein CJ030_MR7G006002 [Morella rubra]
MYCKCRSIKSAESVFMTMTSKNVVSWTAMLVGYGQNGYSEEAIRTFCKSGMRGVGMGGAGDVVCYTSGDGLIQSS